MDVEKSIIEIKEELDILNIMLKKMHESQGDVVNFMSSQCRINNKMIKEIQSLKSELKDLKERLGE